MNGKHAKVLKKMNILSWIEPLLGKLENRRANVQRHKGRESVEVHEKESELKK